MKNTGAYDYQYFKSSKRFQLNPKRTDRFVEEILKHNPKKVLDIGCGLGALVRRLRELNIEAYGIDNAKVLKEKFWPESYFEYADARAIPYPDAVFDVVFSSDFFEHIPIRDLDKVVSEMRRLGNVLIAEIAFETELTERQANYHVTNKPRDWWEKRLPDFIIL